MTRARYGSAPSAGPPARGLTEMSILSMVIKEHFGNGLRKPSPHPLQRYVKLHEFIERRMSEDIYPEYPDPLHARVTHEVLDRINAKWALRGKHVLDIGCGQG